MKNKDLLALAALAGGLYGLNEKNKIDKSLGVMKYDKMARDLGYPVEENTMSARGKKVINVPAYTDTPQGKSEVVRQILNDPDRIGGPRSPVLDRSGNPVSTRSGFAFTEDIPDSAVQGANFRRSAGMKKGGAVKMKSASARADGIAQRGKTRGRMV